MKTVIIYILLAVVILHPVLGNNPPSQDKKKARVRIQLYYFDAPSEDYLTTKVTGRLEKRYEPIDSIGVSFYLSEKSEENFLGHITTLQDGTGKFLLPDSYYQLSDTLQVMKFIAVLDTNPVYQDKTVSVTIKKVDIAMVFDDRDSIKIIHAQVSELDSAGNKIPQKRVNIKFYVDRPLGPLPLGEEVTLTDEEGKAQANFPVDLPGDQNGDVKLLVKILDSDDYGNVERSEVRNWGIPEHMDDKAIRRSLWASGANAPLLLLILVNSLIVAAWGILVYIVVKIRQLRKI